MSQGRLMDDNKWQELDRIHALLPDSEGCGDSEYIVLMNTAISAISEVADEGGGLERLIQRFSASRKAVFPRAIAYHLAKRADKTYYLERTPGGDPDLARLMITFLERLTSANEVGMLTNALNALQYFAWYGGHCPWSETPPVLFAFLQRCLEWDGKGPIVQEFAVEVTTQFLVLGWLNQAITAQSAADLVSRMAKIAQFADGLLDSYVMEARTFLEAYSRGT